MRKLLLYPPGRFGEPRVTHRSARFRSVHESEPLAQAARAAPSLVFSGSRPSGGSKINEVLDSAVPRSHQKSL